jgi:hypothetical protein
MEVERKEGSIDHLWHMPRSPRIAYSRVLEIPAINSFFKGSWNFTRLMVTNQRQDTFWIANLALQEADYFPMRGDGVDWNGYRYMITVVELDPKAYWQQTNVWLGLTVRCVIPPDGDARPIANRGELAPAEQTLPLGL